MRENGLWRRIFELRGVLFSSMRSISAKSHYQADTSPLPWDTNLKWAVYSSVSVHIPLRLRSSNNNDDPERWSPHSPPSAQAQKPRSVTFPKFLSPFRWDLKGFEKEKGRSFTYAPRSHIEHEKSWPEKPAIPNLRPNAGWQTRCENPR